MHPSIDFYIALLLLEAAGTTPRRGMEDSEGNIFHSTPLLLKFQPRHVEASAERFPDLYVVGSCCYAAVMAVCVVESGTCEFTVDDADDGEEDTDPRRLAPAESTGPVITAVYTSYRSDRSYKK